ncbi:uncharacterized protein MKK02DRAFT_31018 [Dioszegia hungarica]|uniref:Apple domain-containing protein n=1 Tax=Dioszegia hungarica TaxID=4972 RepID=A0AA38H0H0_9TREE|nr:uncharacterized protein MKK02DRAFT_31018 [Dioszegia hungarica]KAI9632063.1 hypothetical protein MKK02DRAFT_31018 [Dioszegia hungarica]
MRFPRHLSITFLSLLLTLSSLSVFAIRLPTPSDSNYRVLKQATCAQIVARLNHPRTPAQRRQEASPVPFPLSECGLTSTGGVAFARFVNLDYNAPTGAVLYENIANRDQCTKKCEIISTCTGATYSAATLQCFTLASYNEYFDGGFAVTRRGITCADPEAVNAYFWAIGGLWVVLLAAPNAYAITHLRGELVAARATLSYDLTFRLPELWERAANLMSWPARPVESHVPPQHQQTAAERVEADTIPLSTPTHILQLATAVRPPNTAPTLADGRSLWQALTSPSDVIAVLSGQVASLSTTVANLTETVTRQNDLIQSLLKSSGQLSGGGKPVNTPAIRKAIQAKSGSPSTPTPTPNSALTPSLAPPQAASPSTSTPAIPPVAPQAAGPSTSKVGLAPPGAAPVAVKSAVPKAGPVPALAAAPSAKSTSSSASGAGQQIAISSSSKSSSASTSNLAGPSHPVPSGPACAPSTSQLLATHRRIAHPLMEVTELAPYLYRFPPLSTDPVGPPPATTPPSAPAEPAMPNALSTAAVSQATVQPALGSKPSITTPRPAASLPAAPPAGPRPAAPAPARAPSEASQAVPQSAPTARNVVDTARRLTSTATTLTSGPSIPSTSSQPIARPTSTGAAPAAPARPSASPFPSAPTQPPRPSHQPAAVATTISGPSRAVPNPDSAPHPDGAAVAQPVAAGSAPPAISNLNSQSGTSEHGRASASSALPTGSLASSSTTTQFPAPLTLASAALISEAGPSQPGPSRHRSPSPSISASPSPFDLQYLDPALQPPALDPDAPTRPIFPSYGKDWLPGILSAW